MFKKFKNLLVHDSYYKGILLIGNLLHNLEQKILEHFDNIHFIDTSNSLTENFKNVKQHILSDKESLTTFHIYNDPWFNSLKEFNLDQRKDYKHLIKVKEEKVETDILDDVLCPEYSNVNFCFIDTNGNELDVLKGGMRFLKEIEYLCVRYFPNDLFINHSNPEEILKFLKEEGWRFRDMYIKSSDHHYLLFSKINEKSKYFITADLEGSFCGILFQVFHIYTLAKLFNLEPIFDNFPYYQNLNSLTLSPFKSCLKSDKFKIVEAYTLDKINFHQVVTDNLYFNFTEQVPKFRHLKYKGYFKSFLYSYQYREELVQIINKNQIEIKDWINDLMNKSIETVIRTGTSVGEFLNIKFCAIHICQERQIIKGNADKKYYKDAIQQIIKAIKKQELSTEVVFVLINVKENHLPDVELYTEVKTLLSPYIYQEIRFEKEIEAFYMMRHLDFYILNNSDLSYVSWYMNNDWKRSIVVKPQNLYEEELGEEWFKKVNDELFIKC